MAQRKQQVIVMQKYEPPTFTVEEWAEAVAVDKKARDELVTLLQLQKWPLSEEFRATVRYWEMAADFCGKPRDWAGYRVNQ
jgi:hypothetical protein